MEELLSVARGILGIIIMLGVCYLLSSDRKSISWRVVIVGMGFQFLLAGLLLYVPFVSDVFDKVAEGFTKFLGYSEEGAIFLFGNLASPKSTLGYIFAFRVLPTILFFSAFSSVLYYFGVLQIIIKGAAWVMSKTMGLSGPESIAAAANVFIGQTEAPLVVKPYLESMSKSEILCLMTGGMATIAGGVFAAYIGFLGGDDIVKQTAFAKHLITASIISAPAAIVAAKMLFPETEKKFSDERIETSGDVGNNLLDAISKGTTDGLKLAVNVGAMLLVFTALVFTLNKAIMAGPGEWFGLNEMVVNSTGGRFEGFTFTYILGIVFAPVAWILGTPGDDILVIGQLLGQKTVINEFVAYQELEKIQDSAVKLSEKSLIIATYALCGFANFASIGIQIGGIGAIAPSKRKLLTEFGIKALIGGTIASFLTAALVGMFY
jgi:concentrative nucleoside transporter, CNT family